MNERIKQLAEQIVCFEQDMYGLMEPNEDGQWIRVDELEKFAELIVKKCANIVWDEAEKTMSSDVNDAGYKIIEYFGVTESE